MKSHFKLATLGLAVFAAAVGATASKAQPTNLIYQFNSPMFSIHALWTAAKFAIPSVFVCFVNNEYRLLKDLWCAAMGTTLETTRFVGMDFDNPSVDIQRIAESFGARTEKIDSLHAIGEVLGRALAHSGPSFLIIDREP